MKKACNVIRIILVAIIIFVAALLIVPKVIGFDSLVVLSGSMEPEYHVGSMVYTKDAEFEDIEVGDVISYKLSEDTLVTHRVVEIDEENKTLTTKGDANDVVDESPVRESQIFGIVKGTLPFVGYLSTYIKSGLGIGIMCAVVIVIILLSIIPDNSGKKDEEEQ